jgi:hypothetical protein
MHITTLERTTELIIKDIPKERRKNGTYQSSDGPGTKHKTVERGRGRNKNIIICFETKMHSILVHNYYVVVVKQIKEMPLCI